MRKIVRYIAIMEGEEGRPGSSRPVLLFSDPETVERVIRMIGDRVRLTDSNEPNRGDSDS